MRYQKERDPDASLHALQLLLHSASELAIQRRKRFVEQKDLRAHHESAGKRDALALPARKRMRFAFPEASEIDHVECFFDAAAEFGASEI